MTVVLMLSADRCPHQQERRGAKRPRGQSHAMILEKDSAGRKGRAHDGEVMVMRSKLCWCADARAASASLKLFESLNSNRRWQLQDNRSGLSVENLLLSQNVLEAAQPP